MDLNFFQWLRDSIRRTVLLGVSDAMQSLGTPDDDDTVHPQVAALLAGDQEAAPKTTRSRATTRGGNTNSRKRLGKSLKDLNTNTAGTGTAASRRKAA